MKNIFLFVVVLLVLPFPTLQAKVTEGRENAGSNYYQEFMDAYEKQDYVKALKIIRPVAERGDPLAQVVLGTLYLDGEGVKQDMTEAFRLFSLSAGAEFVEGQYWTGYMYENGLGVKQDYIKAAWYYEKAARQDSERAMHNLGIMYEEGRGVRRDSKEALNWYLKASELGEPDSQYRAGLLYISNDPSIKDEEKGASLLLKAARQDHKMACVILGMNSLAGIGGVKKDKIQALYWLKRGANLGSPTAQFLLGSFYEDGKIVPRNYREAVKWYRMAADYGSPQAQAKLGDMYRDGKGVKKDYRKALGLYKKGAEEGASSAMFSLSGMYEKGLGIKKDCVEAYIWCRAAFLTGSEEAGEKCDLLSKQLTPSQKNKADSLAVLKSHPIDGDPEALFASYVFDTASNESRFIESNGVILNNPAFGIIQNYDGIPKFSSTTNVPCVDGQLYGWIIMAETDKPLIRWREELTVPYPPKTWGDPENEGYFKVSIDGKTSTTEREVDTSRGYIFNFWSIAKGDPKGRYVIKVYVEDKLVETFEFEVK